MVLVDRNARAFEEVRLDLAAQGYGATALECDLTDSEAVAALFAAIDARHGRIDVLVNSAGILPERHYPQDLPLTAWRRTLDVNLTGTFLCAQAAGQRMMRQERGGSIINISSIASVSALGRGNLAYSASKGGVNQLTRELAVEWARYRIRVNALLPCQFRTPAVQPLLESDRLDSRALLQRIVRRHSNAAPGRAGGTGWPRRFPGFRRVGLRYRRLVARRWRQSGIERGWLSGLVRTARIYAKDYAPAAGRITNGRVLVCDPDEPGWPAGLAVDLFRVRLGRDWNASQFFWRLSGCRPTSRVSVRTVEMELPMQLKDKVVIITGASKGLGVAMAEVCAAEGANVVLAARSLEALRRVAQRIEAKGGRCLVVPCDVSKLADLERLVQETLATFGAIHGLINNAGVNFVKPFLETTEADWEHVIGVDLKGSFFLSQLCAREMVKQPRGGSIVQIASVHTYASLPGAAPYDAAKHGMVGFSKAAAVELAKQGVRVNILSPGLCRTEIWNDIVAAAPSEEECIAFWNANIPAERLIEPDEVAHACVFLLSDLSSAITGANIIADLGMTSQLISKEPYLSQTIAGQ